MGGVEQHVSSLAKYLVGLGDEVIVVALGNTPEHSVTDFAGVTVHTFPERFRVSDTLGFPTSAITKKILALVHDFNPDIISTHTRFFPMSWLGNRIARKLNVKLLHTEHGSGFVAHSNPLIRLASKIIDLSFGRRHLKRASQVLAVSESVQDFVKKLSGRDSQIFYNAIERTTTTNNSHNSPKSTAATTSLVFAGRLVHGKGWREFIEASSAVLSAGYEFKGHILGDGPDLSEAKKLVTARGLQNTITLHGRVSPDCVQRHLTNAIYVNPTTLNEGFQTTILESLLNSGTVVSFPIPGVAALLAQNAPIKVTKQKTIDSLTESIVSVLEHPLPPLSESYKNLWVWCTRAEEYRQICFALRQA